MEKIYNSLLKDYFSGEDVENAFDKVEEELNKKINGIDLGAGYAIDLDSRCFLNSGEKIIVGNVISGSLNTTAKDAITAINEVNTLKQTAQQVTDLITDYVLNHELPDDLATEAKTIIDAINEVQLTKPSKEEIQIIYQNIFLAQQFIQQLQNDRVVGLIDPDDAEHKIINLDTTIFKIKNNDDGKVISLDLESPIEQPFIKDGTSWKYQGEGFLNMNNQQIGVLSNPSADKDAVNKLYVDQQDALKQDILVSGVNIQYINGEDILNPGSLDLNTFYYTKDEIDNLIANIPSSQNWIIGEYKWMPIGSTMPNGWIKIDKAEFLPYKKLISAGAISLSDNVNTFPNKGFLEFDNFQGIEENMFYTTAWMTRSNGKNNLAQLTTTLSQTEIYSLPIVNNIFAMNEGLDAELYQYQPALYAKGIREIKPGEYDE